jgi:hypothetical protein
MKTNRSSVAVKVDCASLKLDKTKTGWMGNINIKLVILIVFPIFLLCIICLLRLATGWHIKDIFYGDRVVAHYECAHTRQQFRFVQSICLHEVGYTWSVSYRKNEREQWRIMDVLTWDSYRLCESDVAIDYDYNNDVLTISTKRLRTKNTVYGFGKVKYHFDKNHQGTPVKREKPEFGYDMFWDGKSWSVTEPVN